MHIGSSCFDPSFARCCMVAAGFVDLAAERAQCNRTLLRACEGFRSH